MAQPRRSVYELELNLLKGRPAGLWEQGSPQSDHPLLLCLVQLPATAPLTQIAFNFEMLLESVSEGHK